MRSGVREAASRTLASRPVVGAGVGILDPRDRGCPPTTHADAPDARPGETARGIQSLRRSPGFYVTNSAPLLLFFKILSRAKRLRPSENFPISGNFAPPPRVFDFCVSQRRLFSGIQFRGLFRPPPHDLIRGNPPKTEDLGHERKRHAGKFI